MNWLPLSSYLVAAVSYAATGTILFLSRPEGHRASFLATAAILSSVWAATIALLLYNGDPSKTILVGLDAAHLIAWIVCVLSWISLRSARLWLIVLLGVAVLWLVVASSSLVSVADDWIVYPALLTLALIGFLGVEQVFRNAQQEQRGPLGWLCFAIGGIFAIDLFVYSQATLLQRWIPSLWDVRGFANTALLPAVLLAIKKQREWERELFVSRQVIFYTASLLGVGGYLSAMAILAYVIRAMEADWSLALEWLFLTVAAAVLVFVLFSSTIRARFRTFLVKHFYKNKYDYREQWLRLTQSLGRPGELSALAADSLNALAQIVGSRSGDLWLARDGERYERMAVLGTKRDRTPGYSKDHVLVAFLTSRLWVVDSQEYAFESELYGTAFGDPADKVLPPDSIVVPLDCQGRLLGFAILEKPPEIGALNFEDHDILKTAGKQVAVALAQALALERLAETRQFEATNKMSTFLMHDLKNIIAQQQLVVSNAARFRHRPEFVDDAIATVRSGVERMRRVLDQLQMPLSQEAAGRTEVAKVLMEVRSHCADRRPVPEVEIPPATVWAAIDRDKLASVLTHLVRNAQDATLVEGHVRIDVTTTGDQLVLSVADDGCGMDEVFIRDRLFRPFDSTKGDRGMGIGAYQVRDIVRSAGGDVEVTSTPGAGTTFRVRLRLLPMSSAAGQNA